MVSLECLELKRALISLSLGKFRVPEIEAGPDQSFADGFVFK